MKRLDELFILHGGVAIRPSEVQSSPELSSIPVVRPASTQARTFAGWVHRELVAEGNIYPVGTLFVSTNGEGSHTYSYVSRFEFVPNIDVTVLIPKSAMSIAEKVFYAKCITMNRYLFSYGRKPKGSRLGSLFIPETPPGWVEDQYASYAVENLADSMTIPKDQSIDPGKPGLQKISDLFNIHYGPSLELLRLERDESATGINFVSRTSKNNGVSARVAPIDGIKPDAEGTLSVALGGSTLETFLQREPWYSGRDVAVLTPRYKMTEPELLWWAACIRSNRYRFSYGRQANRTLADLRVPKYIPEWVGSTPRSATEEIRDSLNAVANLLAGNES